MTTIIEVKDLKYKYDEADDHYTLNGVSFHVKQGEWLSIIGHNGSGKSTTVRLIDGLLEAESGEIIIDGDKLTVDNVWEKRRQIGMVFQNPDNQIVATVVEEDVAFGPENLGIEPTEIKLRVAESLKVVNMEDYRHHSPHLLSGGQKQRVAIAGVLAMHSDCLVLDEPTAMLDPKGRQEVLSTVCNLHKEKKITVVYITHFMEEAVVADRVIVMNNGKVVMEGLPSEIFSQVTLLKELGLDVPVAAEMAYRLKEHNINLPEKIITDEELVVNLCP